MFASLASLYRVLRFLMQHEEILITLIQVATEFGPEFFEELDADMKADGLKE